MISKDDKNIMHRREVVDKEAIFKVMEHNDRQSELHRIAFAREVAIGFMKWYDTCDWTFTDEEKPFWNYITNENITHDQLFDEYLKSLNP